MSRNTLSFVVLALVGLSGLAVGYRYRLQAPNLNVFENGQVADLDEVNANFALLDSRLRQGSDSRESLTARLEALDDIVASIEPFTSEQEDLFAHMQIHEEPGVPKTLEFSGDNVRIVSGSGATNGYPDDPTTEDMSLVTSNGLGNLIVGYNELPGSPLARTGSHMVVVGAGHGHTRFGGLVAGRDNRVSGQYSVVAGGTQNAASGRFSAVAGGQDNEASGLQAAAGGGMSNLASGQRSIVLGGEGNAAGKLYAAAGGGKDSSASEVQSVVCGGEGNTTGSESATSMGGHAGEAGSIVGPLDVGQVVLGGSSNAAWGPYTFIAGGGLNGTTSSYEGAAVGGRSNFVSVGPQSLSLGGDDNNPSLGFGQTWGVLLGGREHNPPHYKSTVVGGRNSSCYGESATIVGGTGGEQGALHGSSLGNCATCPD